jgi:hypothetical protein
VTSLLTPAAIDAMRATAARALPDTATLQRRVAGAWTDLATIACRLAPSSAAPVGEQEPAAAAFVITTTVDTDLRSGDRLVLAGAAYGVTLVRRRGAWGITLRADCQPASMTWANATLTAITAVGRSADYDVAAVPGAARWTGSLAVFVVEERDERLGELRDELVQTQVQIPLDVGQRVQRGDTLTYTYEDVAHERVAGSITRDQLAGRALIVLEDA